MEREIYWQPLTEKEQMLSNFIQNNLKLTTILLLISIVLGIIIISIYKNKLPFILSIITYPICTIMSSKGMDYSITGFDGTYKMNLIIGITGMVLVYTLLIFNVVKLIKHIKSDKFRKEK